MELLERAIKEKGKVLPGDVLKVGSFLNQMMDVPLVVAVGKEFRAHFFDKKVTKVLTVEASGIAFALSAAEQIGCDMVFAKKSKSLNSDGAAYSAECMSFTRSCVNVLTVPTEYITKDDRVLIVDDFLAVGNAVAALREIVLQAGATLVGVGIAVEKGFQGGGDKLRAEGVDLLSCAVIDDMSSGEIVFRK